MHEIKILFLYSVFSIEVQFIFCILLSFILVVFAIYKYARNGKSICKENICKFILYYFLRSSRSANARMNMAFSPLLSIGLTSFLILVLISPLTSILTKSIVVYLAVFTSTLQEIGQSISKKAIMDSLPLRTDTYRLSVRCNFIYIYILYLYYVFVI